MLRNPQKLSDWSDYHRASAEAANSLGEWSVQRPWQYYYKKNIYNQVLDSNPLSRALEGTDPLSQFARQDEERDDPLSQSRGEFVSRAPSLK